MSDTQMDSQHSSVCDGEANAVDDLFPRFGFVSFSNTHLLNFSSGLRSIHEHYTPNEEWKLWRRFMDSPHRVSLSILDFPRCPRRRNRFGCGEDRHDTVTTIGRLTDMSITASVLFYVLGNRAVFYYVHGTVLESRISDLLSSFFFFFSIKKNVWLGCGLELFPAVY